MISVKVTTSIRDCLASKETVVSFACHCALSLVNSTHSFVDSETGIHEEHDRSRSERAQDLVLFMNPSEGQRWTS